jgi:ABC-type uncharacterized transport system involved in gliding motility auxiliary subunit
MDNKLPAKKLNRQRQLNIAISIVLVVGIVVMVNFFAWHFFVRWDLTATKLYSISPTSKAVVRNLDDVVQVKLYFSKDLPQEYVSVRQNVLDLLHEYASYSPNFHITEISDINADDAARLGIPKLQFNVLKKDQFQVVNGYLGMSVEYYDRQEIIPIVQSANLEYELTSILKKITSTELPTIGILTSQQTSDVSQEMSVVISDLQKIYVIKPVDLSAVDQIDPAIKTLIMLDPQGQFSDDDQRKLDAFLMQGRSIFVAGDAEEVNNMQVHENPTNLNNYLGKYGLELHKDLVLDQSNGMATFSQGLVNFSLNYPFWVLIRPWLI